MTGEAAVGDTAASSTAGAALGAADRRPHRKRAVPLKLRSSPPSNPPPAKKRGGMAGKGGGGKADPSSSSTGAGEDDPLGVAETVDRVFKRKSSGKKKDARYINTCVGSVFTHAHSQFPTVASLSLT